LPFGAAEDTVGVKNVAAALAVLRSHSIPVTARRTGGANGLLVRLFTKTGEVLVRPIIGVAGQLTAGRVAMHDSRSSNPLEGETLCRELRLPMPS
jgi:chemotaxis protein CheD